MNELIDFRSDVLHAGTCGGRAHFRGADRHSLYAARQSPRKPRRASPCRAAQASMRAAHWAAGKSATVAHLPASASDLLSSKGVPREFVVDVLERVGAGRAIVASTVRQELNAFLENGREIGGDRTVTSRLKMTAPECPPR